LVIIRNQIIVWLVIALTYAVAYSPAVVSGVPFVGSFLLHPYVVVICAALGLFAAWKLAKYPHFVEVVDNATKRNDPLLDFKSAVTQAQLDSVQARDKDY